MANRRIEKSWTWHLKAPREALWPLLSDTARLNEALGLPLYRLRETMDDDGTAHRYGEYEESQARVQWQEPPFEWVRNHWWRWDRFHKEGPIERSRGTLVLEPGKRGGTELRYTLEAEPRGILGHALIRSGHLKEAARRMEKIARQADVHCRKSVGDFYSNLSAARAVTKKTPLPVPEDITGSDRTVLTQAFGWLQIAPDADVMEIRPKRMARALNIGLAEAHSACMLAAGIEAFVPVYRTTCLSCFRNAREANTMAGLTDAFGCPECGAMVRPDISDSVEIFYRPHEALRKIPQGTHCASGPQVFPRIVAQQTLEARDRHDLPITLPLGRYAARVLGEPALLPFEMNAQGGALIKVGDGWIEGPGDAQSLLIENHGERISTVIIETMDLPLESTSLSELMTYGRVREALMPEFLRLPDGTPSGSPVLAVVNVRSDDLGETAYKVAVEHDGAVVEDTGSGVLMVYQAPDSAVFAVDKLLQKYTNARVGLEIGTVTLTQHVGRVVYDGAAKERVVELAGLAQEGIPNLSPGFKVALAK